MTDIKIKALERKDYSRVIDFAITGMHFNRYVDNAIALRLYGRYFLYLELERSTQVLAAYIDERLVGILMADMKDEPKLHSSFLRRLYIKMVDTVMALAFRGGADVYDAANIAMFKEYTKKVSPDGEICFLSADPTIQGKGIGTLLLDELARRERGKLIYLYTDDNCTYQFYEHKGFERSEEKEIKMDFHGKTVPLKCILFSKRLSS